MTNIPKKPKNMLITNTLYFSPRYGIIFENVLPLK